MKIVHLDIYDLFLPKGIFDEACDGLFLPALRKLLARGESKCLGALAYENKLCESFGIPFLGGAPIAPISASYDGLPVGCWLRADPVNLNLQRDRMLLASVQPLEEEAKSMCTSLNGHFAAQGIQFFTPHPQRWYVRLKSLPSMKTTPLSQVIGRNVSHVMPTGKDASFWIRLQNEIQMLLFSHPVNDVREARGLLPINSVWLWGGGCNPDISATENYDLVSSDDVLTEMVSVFAKIPFLGWPTRWEWIEGSGKQLLVWTALRSALDRGDLDSWRNALQTFEYSYAQPLFRALQAGKIIQLRLDVMTNDGIQRISLGRSNALAFWRRNKHLEDYSLV